MRTTRSTTSRTTAARRRSRCRLLAFRSATACALTVALLGCRAGAPPTTPDADLGIDVPARFAADPERNQTAPDPSVHLTEDWWREFEDPGLDALVERALTDNRDLRAAAARVVAAAASRTIAGADGLPRADLGLDTNRARRIFVGFPFGGGVPSVTASTFGLSLNLSWELDVWGRVAAAEGAAVADLQAAAVDHSAARLSLVGQVCKSYFAVTEAQQQLELARGTAETFRATLADVEERHRRGVRPATDVYLAATNLSQAEAQIAARQRQLQQATRQLEVLAGGYPAGATTAAAGLPESRPEIPMALPGELLQRRPDLVAAERRLAAAGCRVDAARAALYPRLSLTASGGTTSDALGDLIDDEFRVWSIGANLLQPIFQGGALRADVRRNEALTAAALATYAGTVLGAFAEVENALAAEGLFRTQEEHLTAAAERAQGGFELARERWERGVADFLLVADGQRQAFQTESARLQLARQRLDNRIDLVLALGGGFDRAGLRSDEDEDDDHRSKP